MSKVTIRIIVGAVILVLLVVRLIYLKIRDSKNEVSWYIENLHYDFYARIDTTTVLSERGNGFFVCSVISGKFDPEIEDSLNRRLKHHDRIRFVRFTDDKRLRFYSGVAHLYKEGDSMVVNSQDDIYRIYRGDELLRENKVSNALSIQQ